MRPYLRAGALAWLALAACSRAIPQRTGLSAQFGADTLLTAELKVRAFELGRRASGIIAFAADTIRLVARDPLVRQRALLWKINVVPAVQEAALLPDPLGAAGDIYVLAGQMRAFFTTGTGRDIFGPHQGIAVAASDTVAADAMRLMRAVFRGDSVPAQVRGGLDRWVGRHPVTSLAFVRPSLAADLPAIAAGATGGMVRAVGDLNEQVGTIGDRLGYMSEFIPKQLRWNVQLITEAAVGTADMKGTLGTGIIAIERLGRLADTMPALAGGERAAVVDALTAERAALLRGVDSQRVATLDAITAERAAVLDAITRERAATLLAVDSIVNRSLDRSTGVVDHIFWRLAQVLAVALVGLLAVALLTALFLRSPRRGARVG